MFGIWEEIKDSEVNLAVFIDRKQLWKYEPLKKTNFSESNHK